VLRLTALSKTLPALAPGLPPRQLLCAIDLDLAPGEYVAIMGESGSGKSTLLNLIAGLDRPSGGQIELAGRNLSTLDDDGLTRLRAAKMGFVFQAFHVLPHLTVAQNVALPLALNRIEAKDTRVNEMLDAVGLAARAGSRPRELSGGELQRVAIARALVHRPALVLADEPTGNLDPETAARVLALLRDAIRARKANGIIVTHSRAAAASADRVLRLGNDGRLHAA
jgi:putative ABC transport system ATP-binding protein